MLLAFFDSTTRCQLTLQFTNKHNGNCNMALSASFQCGLNTNKITQGETVVLKTLRSRNVSFVVLQICLTIHLLAISYQLNFFALKPNKIK